MRRFFFIIFLLACDSDSGTVSETFDAEVLDEYSNRLCGIHSNGRGCSENSYCERPGLCVLNSRCIKDDECEQDLFCHGGICRSEEEIEALPTPIAWGYISRHWLRFKSDRSESCFGGMGDGNFSELSHYINISHYGYYNENNEHEAFQFLNNLNPRSEFEYLRNDEWTQLFGLTEVENGYLLQIFTATNDLDNDGEPDQSYATRQAGEGIFRISRENYERGRSRAIFLDEIGSDIIAGTATDLPWRMPLLPYGRRENGIHNYMMHNASVFGDLFMENGGLYTGHTMEIRTRYDEEYPMEHGNFTIGGSFLLSEIFEHLLPFVENCGCPVRREPYIFLHDERIGSFCVDRDQSIGRCEGEDERPFWCSYRYQCDSGPISRLKFRDLDEDLDGVSDSYTSCFQPDIVPAQVIIEN